MEAIKTYKDFTLNESYIEKSRKLIRSGILWGKSLNKDISKSSNWIRFPYYHHVFDDEKRDFERQLIYLKRYGDFISIEMACQLINSNEKIDGRFFCLSFDDGFYSCYSNMMDITTHLNITVVIYLPTNCIGLDINKEDDFEKIKKFNPNNTKLLPFLSWDNCKEMLLNNISFGSHTLNHANLSKLSKEEIETELWQSKMVIEQKLQVSCDHFACPWGRKDIDFFPDITTEIAKKVGYTSFATTNRGKMVNGENLYLLKRDHVLAQWGNFQLKYFFSL